MEKILIFEDNLKDFENYHYSFKDDFTVLQITSENYNEKGLSLFDQADLLIIEHKLKSDNGLNIVKNLKESGFNQPIILKGKDVAENVIIEAFRNGVDDFIKTPIPVEEWKARIRNRIKKYGRKKDVDFGSFDLLPELHSVKLNETVYDLTPTEFKIVSILWENKDKIVTSQQINNLIWNNSKKGNHNLNVHLNNIRSKIPPLSESIRNKKSMGFYFKTV